MKKRVSIFLVCIFALPVLANEGLKEKSVRHLKIADVTSMEEAKEIFY